MTTTTTTTARITTAAAFPRHRAVYSKPANVLFDSSAFSPSSSISLPYPKTFLSSTPTLSSSIRPSLLLRPVATWSFSDGKKAESKGSKEKEQVVVVEEEEEEEEVEEELPWIQEKALDLVEFTGSVTQALPGPRVGHSSLPWILAVPLAYLGFTFVVAFVKTVRKFSSPKEKRRQLVNKNAMLCSSIDALFEKGRDEVNQSALMELMQKTGFAMEEILRKYIRYALNERPFNPDLIVDLIQLRKASGLDDSVVAGILNEISRRIVKDKGPVVMDMSGYSEKGLKKKVSLQALFGKVFYLSEMPEFCSKDSSLTVKEIFGVTDEDAEKLRLQLTTQAEAMDSLEKMVDTSDTENP